MTSRSSFSSKRRPLSAIFLGAGPTPSPSDLPDLPEPPSPSTSSSHSGLPSPPATNSTGSDSAGDSRETRRSHPLASDTLIMRNDKPLTSRSSRPSSPPGGSESRKAEDDEEEDNTARLSVNRPRGLSQSNDHAMTLQRVMSLTQRNRMVSPSVFRASLSSIHSPHNAAYRPSINSLLCALIHLPHLNPLTLPALPTLPSVHLCWLRLLPVSVPDRWNLPPCLDQKQNASLSRTIQIHLMINLSHHRPPSRRLIQPWMHDSDAFPSPPLLPKEKLLYQCAVSHPDRYKGHPRSVCLLCPCPTQKDMNTIPMTSPPPLWRR